MASGDKQQPALTSGVSHLVRSLSKKPTKVNKPDQSSSPPYPEVAHPNETSSTKTDSKIGKIMMEKLTAFEKFMQLRKGKSEKPPSSWYIDETVQAASVLLPPTPATDAESKLILETKDEERVQDDTKTNPEGKHEAAADEAERSQSDCSRLYRSLGKYKI